MIQLILTFKHNIIAFIHPKHRHGAINISEQLQPQHPLTISETIIIQTVALVVITQRSVL